MDKVTADAIQKAKASSTNGNSNNNNSSSTTAATASKKRKKDLKPIITNSSDGAAPEDADMKAAAAATNQVTDNASVPSIPPTTHSLAHLPYFSKPNNAGIMGISSHCFHDSQLQVILSQ